MYVYYGTNMIDLSGKIEINCAIKKGMIIIGKKWQRSQGKTNILNRGIWVVNGEVMICKGTRLMISSNAVFHTGDHVNIRENCNISVNKNISIGDCSGIAYFTQIMDSDFHYMIDVNSRQCHYAKGNIKIGKNNWIGSFTTIKKGTITPDNCIVASSYAVLSKDYTKNIPEFSIIGGIPARLITTGKRRVFNMTTQAFLSTQLYNEECIYTLPTDKDIDTFCNY